MVCYRHYYSILSTNRDYSYPNLNKILRFITLVLFFSFYISFNLISFFCIHPYIGRVIFFHRIAFNYYFDYYVFLFHCLFFFLSRVHFILSRILFTILSEIDFVIWSSKKYATIEKKKIVSEIQKHSLALYKNGTD